MSQQNLEQLQKEVLEALEKLNGQPMDEIEQLIDALKAKEKDGGLFVVLQKEFYTTTN